MLHMQFLSHRDSAHAQTDDEFNTVFQIAAQFDAIQVRGPARNESQHQRLSHGRIITATGADTGGNSCTRSRMDSKRAVCYQKPALYAWCEWLFNKGEQG